MTSQCAPGMVLDNGSCIPLYILIDMAHAYNKFIDKDFFIINDSDIVYDPHGLKKTLVKAFRSLFRKKCGNSQHCWITQPFSKLMTNKYKNTLHSRVFRIIGPTENDNTRTSWLNTTHINDFVSQYVHIYPNFIWLGTLPNDFDTMKRYHFDENRVKDGIEYMGAIINLDSYGEPGSHWVSLFVSFMTKEIFFYDSYGVPPDPNITNFMKRVCSFKIMDGKCVTRYNKIQHQFGNTECGVFCLNFIVNMLKSPNSFNTLMNRPLNDDIISKCRKIYFNAKM